MITVQTERLLWGSRTRC